jgi:hypothetical protein
MSGPFAGTRSVEAVFKTCRSTCPIRVGVAEGTGVLVAVAVRTGVLDGATVGVFVAAGTAVVGTAVCNGGARSGTAPAAVTVAKTPRTTR